MGKYQRCTLRNSQNGLEKATLLNPDVSQAGGLNAEKFMKYSG
jgi:hypothetical protein